MRAPVIQGIIRRRILLNFRVEPEVVQRHLPHPFKPKLMRGWAIAGVCLIRLERIRPRLVRLPIGITSENAAHRVAVVWTDEQGHQHEGVYIPRRDTNAIANYVAGGRLFPGEHHKASFQVKEADGSIDLRLKSNDGLVSVEICGSPGDALPPSSAFASIEEASAFFERGCYGYSATRDGGRPLPRLRTTPLAAE